MSRKVSSTPATTSLEALGVAYEALPYDHDPRVIAYGQEAAAALGVPAEHVFKTLVMSVAPDRFGVAVVPVSARADLKAVAAALGGKKAALAAEADVRRLTGYVLGGVSPFGTRTRLATVVDSSAAALETMYVSGGRRGLDLAVAPADLVRVTEAILAPVTSSP